MEPQPEREGEDILYGHRTKARHDPNPHAYSSISVAPEGSQFNWENPTIAHIEEEEEEYATIQSASILAAPSGRAKAGARKFVRKQPPRSARGSSLYSQAQVAHVEHGGTLPPRRAKESVQHGKGSAHRSAPRGHLREAAQNIHASLHYPRTLKRITIDHEGFEFAQEIPKKRAPLVGLNGYDARLYINYRQEVTKAKRIRKQESPIIYSKDESIDDRFWMQFHADYYFSVFLSSDEPIVEMQWIDWEYMKNKHDPDFDLVIRVCEKKGIKDLMGFRYDWNEEIILQVFATLYFR
jgi:hypothetical protein